MRKLFFFLSFIGFLNLTNAQFATDVQASIKVENVRAQQFQEKINKDKEAQVIDIRTSREYQSGHIKNAVMIDFYNPNFTKEIEKAKFNKSKPIYIYCRSGNRSGHSIKIFKSLGFTHIVNLAFGINDWRRSGFALVQ